MKQLHAEGEEIAPAELYQIEKYNVFLHYTGMLPPLCEINVWTSDVMIR